MSTNGNPPDVPAATPTERVAEVCREITAARAAGDSVHRYRFAMWGHALGLSIEQVIDVTGLTQVDYGPRVSPERWRALEEAQRLLEQTQARSERRARWDDPNED